MRISDWSSDVCSSDLLNVPDLLADHLPPPLLVLHQKLELLLLLGEGRVLFANDDLLQLAQGAQAHVENRLSLDVAQLPALHHLRLRIVLLADDADHLVEVEEIGSESCRERVCRYV